MRKAAKSRQYAQLLLNIAEQQSALEDVYRSMTAFFDVYRKSPQLKAALASKRVKNADKEALLSKLFPNLHAINQALLITLGEEKDMKVLGEIIHHLELGYYQRSNRVRVEAVSTEKLSPELEQSIRETVEKVTSHSADFSARVDEDILGGMTLRVGNTILDGSVASQLAQIRDTLLES